MSNSATETLRAVLQKFQTILLANRLDGRIIRRQPEQIHRHHGRRLQRTGIAHCNNRFLQFGRIKVESALINIDEHRRRSNGGHCLAT